MRCGNISLKLKGILFRVTYIETEDPKEMKLRITKLQLSDAGNYRCEIAGLPEKLTSTSNLTVNREFSHYLSDLLKFEFVVITKISYFVTTPKRKPFGSTIFAYVFVSKTER